MKSAPGCRAGCADVPTLPLEKPEGVRAPVDLEVLVTLRGEKTTQAVAQ